MTYQKSSPKIVERAHQLRAAGLSIRKIADQLHTSKSIIEAALKKSSTVPPPAVAQTPRLEIYRRIREPAPPPPELPATVAAVYEELRAADLVGALDALVIGLDIPVPRCRIALNVLDADDVLQRLKAAGVVFDLDVAVRRLTEAFAQQDDERATIRAAHPA